MRDYVPTRFRNRPHQKAEPAPSRKRPPLKRVRITGTMFGFPLNDYDQRYNTAEIRKKIHSILIESGVRVQHIGTTEQPYGIIEYGTGEVQRTALPRARNEAYMYTYNNVMGTNKGTLRCKTEYEYYFMFKPDVCIDSVEFMFTVQDVLDIETINITVQGITKNTVPVSIRCTALPYVNLAAQQKPKKDLKGWCGALLGRLESNGN